MEYSGINESWEEYLETVQSSKYMQRLSLKEDERLFREGYQKGFEEGQLSNLAELLEKAFEAGMEYEQLAIYVMQPAKSYSAFATDNFKEKR
jgi:hypothetical protein